MGNTLDEVSLLCADKRLMPTGRGCTRIGSARPMEPCAGLKGILTAAASLFGVGSRMVKTAA